MRKRYVGLILALTLVVLFGATACGGKVEDLVAQYLDAVKAGDYETAYSMLAPVLQEEMSLEDFSAQMAALDEEAGPISSYEFHDITRGRTGNAGGIVPTTITRVKNGTETVTEVKFVVKRIEGTFKLGNYK